MNETMMNAHIKRVERQVALQFEETMKKLHVQNVLHQTAFEELKAWLKEEHPETATKMGESFDPRLTKKLESLGFKVQVAPAPAAPASPRLVQLAAEMPKAP